MSENFQNILTTIGQQKRATAEAGGNPVNITHFKVGDGNGQYYDPTETQTDLVNTRYTGEFGQERSQIVVNPCAVNEVLYKCHIPADVGGFTVRELGLFDADNNMISICKLPAQDKFSIDSGLYQPLTFTLRIIFTNPQTQAVLTPISVVIATQEFVLQEMTNHLDDLEAHSPLFAQKADKTDLDNHKADTEAHNPQFAQKTDKIDFENHKIDNAAHSALFAQKADKNGNSSEVFDVAYATNPNHAVPKGQLSSLISSIPIGTVGHFARNTAPDGWLKCNGAAVSRTTYSNLFAELATNAGFSPQTFTATIASPAVFTKANHGFIGGERLRLFTTGALPSGLSTPDDYYVEKISANTFYLQASPGGARVNTSGTQSGTHSYLQSWWGLGDGSTTFNLPDARNEFLRGWADNSDRAFASWQNHMFEDHTHITSYPTTHYMSGYSSSGVWVNHKDINTGLASSGNRGAETRPRNIALLACIKY